LTGGMCCGSVSQAVGVGELIQILIDQNPAEIRGETLKMNHAPRTVGSPVEGRIQRMTLADKQRNSRGRKKIQHYQDSQPLLGRIYKSGRG